jgi:hypothetical protein
MKELHARSKGMRWTGIALSTVTVLFMLMDATMKLIKPAFVVEASAQLGFPGSTLRGIGLALLLSTLLYVVPRTSILGAILVTGYLGGAVATNVRAETPEFNLVFPVIFGILLWGGLWLRDQRLRTLLPFTGEVPSQNE